MPRGLHLLSLYYCSLCPLLSLSQVNVDDEENYQRMLELWFLFCVIWSLGASVDEESRRKMDTYIRELEGQFPSKVQTQNKVFSLFE